MLDVAELLIQPGWGTQVHSTRIVAQPKTDTPPKSTAPLAQRQDLEVPYSVFGLPRLRLAICVSRC